MRLTSDLIAESPTYINPLKMRELDLRGHQIPAIENLGVTNDQNECIDLTDNAILSLSNLPRLLRLNTLLLAHNNIQTIAPSLGKNVPNLRNLVLTANAISELFELTPLKELKKLEFLSLMDCPVQRKQNYRLWVLYLCPSVRCLDFTKVKDAERKLACETFNNETPNNTAS